MKKKTLITLFLALAMVLNCTSIFAEGEESDGSKDVNGVLTETSRATGAEKDVVSYTISWTEPEQGNGFVVERIKNYGHIWNPNTLAWEEDETNTSITYVLSDGPVTALSATVANRSNGALTFNATFTPVEQLSTDLSAYFDNAELTVQGLGISVGQTANESDIKTGTFDLKLSCMGTLSAAAISYLDGFQDNQSVPLGTMTVSINTN